MITNFVSVVLQLSSVFSSAIIQPPMEPSTGLIHEAMRKLSTLWDTQTKEIESVTEVSCVWHFQCTIIIHSSVDLISVDTHQR